MRFAFSGLSFLLFFFFSSNPPLTLPDDTQLMADAPEAAAATRMAMKTERMVSVVGSRGETEKEGVLESGGKKRRKGESCWVSTCGTQGTNKDPHTPSHGRFARLPGPICRVLGKGRGVGAGGPPLEKRGRAHWTARTAALNAQPRCLKKFALSGGAGDGLPGPRNPLPAPAP